MRRGKKILFFIFHRRELSSTSNFSSFFAVCSYRSFALCFFFCFSIALGTVSLSCSYHWKIARNKTHSEKKVAAAARSPVKYFVKNVLFVRCVKLCQVLFFFSGCSSFLLNFYMYSARRIWIHFHLWGWFRLKARARDPGLATGAAVGVVRWW